MKLVIYERALEMIAEIKPLIETIKQHDRDLANQLRRSASSVALNISEGTHSRGGNKRIRFENAAGSAAETRAALQVATAWGYIPSNSQHSVDQLLDQILAMLFRLTHPPG